MSDLHLKSKAVFDALTEVKQNSFTLAGTQLIVRLQKAIDDYESSINEELEGLEKALEERCAENLRYRRQVLSYWKLESEQLAEIERLQKRIVELGGKA